VITYPAWCGIPHRVMIGDDGRCNHYRIEFSPNIKKEEELKRGYRRLCGEGIFDHRDGIGPAKDQLGGHKVVTHVVTTSEEDMKLAAAAAALDKQTTTYCIIWKDCRAVEACVHERALANELLKKMEEIINDLLKAIFTK
jgi:hypothetical protein